MLRRPDGTTEVLDLRARAVLALFTDGLIERAGTDIDQGIERQRRSIVEAGGACPADVADRVIGEAGRAADRPDDIALLLAARWTDVSRAFRAFRASGKSGTSG